MKKNKERNQLQKQNHNSNQIITYTFQSAGSFFLKFSIPMVIVNF
tara:strand:- start:191 stop:325 length:135 start_codon:yes stop_codon:yes gene_type:complete